MNVTPKRTFGWIQNPGKLENLKKTVGIFINGSESNRFLSEIRLPLLKKNKLISENDYMLFNNYLRRDQIVVPYVVLKGKGCGGKRNSAICTGLVQAVIDAQQNKNVIDLEGKNITIKKPYTDDWTADGFLRWGVSTGLLAYNEDNDTISITHLGIELIETEENSEAERAVFAKALMKYPPVQRVLRILGEDKTNEGLTKFEIGAQLGFVGEMGFTSIDQGYYLALLSSSEKPSVVRNNVEGDSDKYARMIAGWLVKMGWVETVKKLAFGFYRGVHYQDYLQAYRLTVVGEEAFKRARGNSSNKRIPKIVQFEMLATKAPDANYLRQRRANILFSLAKPSSVHEILACLQKVGLKENAPTILDDIVGLRNIGLDIVDISGKGEFVLNEKLEGLRIPVGTEEKEAVTELKDKVRGKLQRLSHDYLILIDLAYSEAVTTAQKNKDARDFEVKTADLFVKELSFNGERLGDANRPDVVIWKGEYGVIIDNKSYKDGFNIGRGNEDEMSRYVEQAQNHQAGQPANEWWQVFVENKVSKLNFLFITSFLKGNFVDNLSSLSKRRNIRGAAIGVENLLYLAEKIQRGDFLEENFHTLFENNEIKIAL